MRGGILGTGPRRSGFLVAEGASAEVGGGGVGPGGWGAELGPRMLGSIFGVGAAAQVGYSAQPARMATETSPSYCPPPPPPRLQRLPEGRASWKWNSWPWVGVGVFSVGPAPACLYPKRADRPGPADFGHRKGVSL